MALLPKLVILLRRLMHWFLWRHKPIIHPLSNLLEKWPSGYKFRDLPSEIQYVSGSRYNDKAPYTIGSSSPYGSGDHYSRVITHNCVHRTFIILGFHSLPRFWSRRCKYLGLHSHKAMWDLDRLYCASAYKIFLSSKHIAAQLALDLASLQAYPYTSSQISFKCTVAIYISNFSCVLER